MTELHAASNDSSSGDNVVLVSDSAVAAEGNGELKEDKQAGEVNLNRKTQLLKLEITRRIFTVEFQGKNQSIISLALVSVDIYKTRSINININAHPNHFPSLYPISQQFAKGN